MDIIGSLAFTNRNLVFEVAYLVGVYLTHRLDEAAWKASIMASDPERSDSPSLKVALDIIHRIEDQEGKKIKDLNSETRQAYLQEIGSVSRDVTLGGMDPALLSAAENELKALRQDS